MCAHLSISLLFTNTLRQIVFELHMLMLIWPQAERTVNRFVTSLLSAVSPNNHLVTTSTGWLLSYGKARNIQLRQVLYHANRKYSEYPFYVFRDIIVLQMGRIIRSHLFNRCLRSVSEQIWNEQLTHRSVDRGFRGE